MFGEISVIDGEPRSASVEIEEDCLLGTLSAERFLGLIAEHPTFGRAVMMHLAAHVRRLSRRVFEFSTLSVQARVHAELLRLAEVFGVRDNQSLLSPAPRLVDVADSVSTTREAVSRVIGRLKARGIVERASNPRILRILNVEALRELVREAKGE
jgi:CRP-like cAMP-binding protein